MVLPFSWNNLSNIPILTFEVLRMFKLKVWVNSEVSLFWDTPLGGSLFRDSNVHKLEAGFCGFSSPPPTDILANFFHLYHFGSWKTTMAKARWGFFPFPSRQKSICLRRRNLRNFFDPDRAQPTERIKTKYEANKWRSFFSVFFFWTG